MPWFVLPEFQYTELNMDTMSVSGAPAMAVLKMFVCVAMKLVWYPPQLCPCRATLAESTTPLAIAAFTAGTTHHTAERPGSSSLYAMSGMK